MPLVGAYYVPNAPHLIAPSAFGGRGQPTVDRLRGLRVPELLHPDALLVVSPHWVSQGPFLVQASGRPTQLFDFSGFPPALSQIRYEPTGDPDLARRVADSARGRGVPVESTTAWGLDHGAWAPLLALAPGGRVPTVPLSIAPYGPREHLAWGAAVGAAARATAERVVLVGTGSILHAFSRFQPSSDRPWPEGAALEAQVARLAAARASDALLGIDARSWAMLEPEGNLAPLFTVLGALDAAFEGRVVGTEQLHGAFGMTVLEWLPGPLGTRPS